MMHPVHQRIGELSALSRRRNLTYHENKELDQCLKVNENMCFEAARITNLSLIAYETNDVLWQHEICAEQERFEKWIGGGNAH